MKLHRFIGDFNLSKNQVEITDSKNIKQIKGVLRLLVGDNLVLGDGKGKVAEVKIENISKEVIDCKIIRPIPSTDPEKKVSLYLAILKKENFELAVQKAVECGVTNIIPVITERTVKTGLNIARLEKIIREASEQCERSILPVLQKTINFENALAHGYASMEKVIFHTSAEIYRPSNSAKSASIFIGPEGGFTDKEIRLAEVAKYEVASLGPLILRGETASTIATYRVVQGI